MRCIPTLAVWGTCACLLATFNPSNDSLSWPTAAHAEPKKDGNASRLTSIRRCMSFTQTLGEDEASVDFHLKSRCKFEVLCSLQWELTCPSTSGSSVVAEGHKSKVLAFSDSWRVNAPASICEQNWEINEVKWSCVPL